MEESEEILLADRDNFLPVKRQSYFQGMQIVKCFDFSEKTLRFAALLSLLYLQDFDESRPSIETFQKWISEIIREFIDGDTRNQTDQPDKILAVAIYLNILFSTGYDEYLDRDRLEEFIIYAENQSWFRDPFIAFYCYKLHPHLTICNNARDYLVSNFSVFLSRKNLQAISLAFITAIDGINVMEVNRGRELLETEASKENISLFIGAWCLLGLSCVTQSKKYSKQLVDLIDGQLEKFLTQLFQETHIFSYLASLWEENEIVSIGEQENPSKRVNTKKQEIPSLFDLGLCLLALRTTGNHVLYGIQKQDIDVVLKLAEKGNRVDKGSIVLSRNENIAGNILVIFSTFLIGVIFVFILWGELSLSYDFSNFEKAGFVVYVIGFIDYIAAQIQAAASGKSAMSGLLQLPILRHVIKFNRG